MASTKQIAHTRKKTQCSFCGEEGHNRRRCEIATFARCFFLDPLEIDQVKERKCSNCGEAGHYCTTCPWVLNPAYNGPPPPPLEENPRPQNSNPNCTLRVGPVVPKPLPPGSKRRPVLTQPPLTTLMGARWPLETHTIKDLHTPIESVEIYAL